MFGQEEERRIRCPKCGKMAPAMTYCIYCGARLPKVESVEVRGLQPQPAPSRLPAAPPTVKISPPTKMPPKVHGEIVNLMSDITRYCERKIALLDLFRSGEVSEKVFLKLYDEYSHKLSDLLRERSRKMEDLKSDLESKVKSIDDVKMSIEELEVRHKIGEVDDLKFNEKMRILRMERNRLEGLVKDLKEALNRLERLFSDKSPREVLGFDSKVRMCHQELEKLVEDGRLSEDNLEKVKSDLEEMMKLFNSVIGERKKKEKVLREQLETLQARYRVSEISIEEYEKRKRELQEEIDKIWM